MEENKLQELERRLINLEKDFSFHRHTGLDGKKVGYKDLIYKAGATLAKPTGGATVDSQARTAINDIIDLLKGNRMIK
jgi:hypothetical protein